MRFLKPGVSLTLDKTWGQRQDQSAGVECGERAELFGNDKGAWLGNMMPPAPTRMVRVAAATRPMTTAAAALAIPGMLWCSASQYR